MKTNTKLIIASTLFIALFAGQTAIASEATEENYFTTATVSNEQTEIRRDIVRYSLPAPEEAHENEDSYTNFFPEGQGQ